MDPRVKPAGDSRWVWRQLAPEAMGDRRWKLRKGALRFLRPLDMSLDRLLLFVDPAVRLGLLHHGSEILLPRGVLRDLGPFPPIMVADWLADRVAGKPFPSEQWYVRSNGAIEKKPL